MDRRASPSVRRWLPLLLAALLLAQTLGLLHRVLHVPGGHGAAHASAASAFGHDDGDLQCRLYDQAMSGDLAFGSAALALAAAPSVVPDGVLPAGRFAPQAAGFLARGPPLLTA